MILAGVGMDAKADDDGLPHSQDREFTRIEECEID
jgi:hypothetical protein